MSTALVATFSAIVTGLVGTLAGWWLGVGSARREPRQIRNEVHRVREVLGRLYGLVNRMAVDVGEHRTQVQEVNRELLVNKTPDADAIIQAVARLVEINDATQGRLVSAEQKLREQAKEIEFYAAEALTDPLTLLPNRRAFDEELVRRIAEADRRGDPLCILIFDVDHFKKLNDTYGHLAGDEVLHGLGRVLLRSMRQMDMIARFGGEEFAAILPATSIEDAKKVAARAREQIEEALLGSEEQVLRITASIGVAERLPGEGGPELIQRADEALYAAKKGGRNCVHWHDGWVTHPLADAGKTVTPQPHAEQCQETSPASGQPSAENLNVATPRSAEPVSTLPASIVPEGQHRRASDRRTFCQVVCQRVAERKRGGPTVSMILVEIDRYEQIIRRHPRPVGQFIVSTVEKLLAATVREMDLVARYSVDRFALLLPSAQFGDAVRIGERLHQAIARWALKVEEQFRFTISIGVAEVTQRDDMASFIQRAEAALDSGRRRGGGCTYYHDGRGCVPIGAVPEAPGCVPPSIRGAV